MSRCKACFEFQKPDFDVALSYAQHFARSGCEYCKIIVAVMQRALPENNVGTETWGHFTLAGQGSAKTMEMRDFWPKEEIDCPKKTVFEIFTTRSSESLSLISKWTEECFSSHENCIQAPHVPPSRLIDVGTTETDVVKLCFGLDSSNPLRYCALSHCWGLMQPLTTTTETLTKRSTGIRFTELPRTFQDAITIARKLSVQYLWIDSLCILQNDKEDWEKESSRMASIYESAYLVIAATHASDSSVGCFLDQPVSHTAATPCHEHITPSNNSVPIYVRFKSTLYDDNTHDHYSHFSMFDAKRQAHLPLNSRAWVLQERILATRTVHFTGRELVWECRSMTLCECMDLGPQFTQWLGIKQSWIQALQGSMDRYDFWRRIMELYMQLSITKQSDRLPAASGLAKQFQGGRYLAGLWEENLFADLLWTVYPDGTRASKWQAPSWSWAGVVGATYLGSTLSSLSGKYFTLDNTNLRPPRVSAQEYQNISFKTTCIAINCSPAGEDPTGQVAKYSSLEISAPLISVSIKKESDMVMVCKDGKEMGFEHDCFGDFATLEEDKPDFFCVWIGTTWLRDDRKFYPQLLILRTSQGIGGVSATPGAYERIGALGGVFNRSHDEWNDYLTFDDWFKDSKITTVKIV
ncbi:hypothetical protein G7Y89_g8055 [Cudoniella acicularis]|uniref:Heterokaryon incompatibility domain-containing protein n=1 Tax=Cudoniella acicularis TaxID=354080 RepID=A0A8H4RI60_9HELO|nr:hypothetical protein G7Y89_g8055 [Cudoniella acicularis]